MTLRPRCWHGCGAQKHHELGGNIEIEIESGRGSAHHPSAPDPGNPDVPIISVGDEIYIVPLISIIESLQVRPDGINLVAGRGEAFKPVDEYLPVVRLHEVFESRNRAQDLKDGLAGCGGKVGGAVESWWMT